MTESALAAPIPEVAGLVDRHRAEYDPSAAWGIGPHVTVLYPFLPPDDLGADRLAEVRSFFERIPGFAFELRRTATFPRVLYLAPEPVEAIANLTRLVTARYPGYPPCGGAFDEVVPHVTVAHDVDDDVIATVRAEVEPCLPVRGVVREVHLYVGANEAPGWDVLARFALS